ncbi:MAG TPA: carboxymuconolactone decarboxylase family protein [Rhizomicrobium sp.]|nr:carboxymuconolactone decarboxylase family protein [Rhizomicrobium sp.]
MSSGNRFGPLEPRDMSNEQREARDAWVKSRGAIGGPANLLLRSPKLAMAFEHLGGYLRFESGLPKKLKELAIIIVARAWTAQFEWHIHSSLAIEAGLDRAKCDAIGGGYRPAEMDADEAKVFDFVSELVCRGHISDEVFNSVRARFGDTITADLVALAGYYCAVSLILNADGVPLPPDAVPLPILPSDINGPAPFMKRFK